MAAPVTYTTQIAATKTVGEVQELLARNGAKRIAVDYTDGEPSGLSFALELELGLRLFSLPVNIEAMMEKMILEDRKGNLRSLASSKRRSREQASKVAWRVMKMWVEAQLAMIDTGMVELEEVMLPYVQLPNGETAFENYKSSELMQLVTGSDA